jgi:(4-(4-[2-(gamma-L-glutamylamino)ethyl]phenoxymethyl)furan-2-yl)methanamine synthase
MQGSREGSVAVHLGWDIGGAHLKLSRLTCRRGGGKAEIRTFIVPFEIWKDPGGLASRLRSMLDLGAESDDLSRSDSRGERGIASQGLTMTAEISDAFPARAEGVRSILSACAEALEVAPILVLDLEGRFVSLDEAMEKPLAVAAANWMATARLAAELRRGALLIDVGSTTTDLVPILDGRPSPKGRDDTERLLSGELVYSGAQRTPPASFVDAVPLRGGWCRLSPEHFAVTADVYRVLGRLDDAAYTVATPDGRGKGKVESAARLARLVCSDLASLTPAEIEGIASYLEDRQVDQLSRAIRQVMSRHTELAGVEGITAGTGAFLARAAAARAGIGTRPLSRLLPGLEGDGWDTSAPSAAIALLLARDSGDLELPLGGKR